MATNTIQNDLPFGAPRRTILLNAHNKDDYGRHRGQVLYGMQLTGSGTVLSIAPGALYTSQGLRIFWDVTDGSVDIGPSSIVDAFNVLKQSQMPFCVLISLRYRFNTDQTAQSISVTTAIGQGALFTLGCRIVPFDINTGAPAYNLQPVEPVYLTLSQPSSYGGLQNWNGPAIQTPNPGTANSDAIQFGDIPIGYVMLGVNPVGGAYPTSLTSAGVSIVSYDNAFNMISDLVGQDVLLPLQPTNISSGLVQPTTGTAVAQGYSAALCGSNLIPIGPVVRPAWGTPMPGGSGTRIDSSFEAYRQPNFIKDGTSIMEAIRRMDVVQRQWLDFTGDQNLIAVTQDGTSSLPIQASLDQILAKFDGGLTALTNLNTIAWPNGASGSDPANHSLKEGLLPHVENTIVGKLGTTEGDSLRSAITAVDIALSVVLGSVLGVSIPRSQLRDTTGGSYTPVSYDERPEGRPALLDPTLGGTGANIYLTTQSLRTTVLELMSRTQSGSGANLISNAGFWSGDSDSGNQATPPPFWAINGSTGTWTRSENFSGRVGKSLAVSLDANSTFDQSIVGNGSNYLGAALASASHISYSALIQNTSAQGIRILVTGYSDAGGMTSVFSALSDLIPQGSVARIVTGTLKIGASDLINNVRFRVVSDTPSNPCSFVISGVSLNTGMPKSSLSGDSLPTDFVSLDGGSAKQMRGHFYAGAFQGKNAANATDPQDWTTLTQLTAVDTALTTAISNEVTRATTAEGLLNTAISNEVTRATTAEALLAPLANPALTGTPTAPTAAFGTSTTQIATTAFVQASRSFATTVVVTASASIVMPAGITLVQIEAWGGGSSGQGNVGVFGGGGGAYVQTVISISSGDTLNIVIGAGGAVSGTTAQNSGGDTTVAVNGGSPFLTAGGAVGITGGVPTVSGSFTAVNSLLINGQRGGGGGPGGGGGTISGSGGDAPRGGSGGPAFLGTPPFNGNDGQAPGGGGASGGTGNSGAGAQGWVILRY